MKIGFSHKHVFVSILVVAVVLSFTVPRSSARTTPTTSGDSPKIILPFPPGSQIMLAVHWSLSPNMNHSFSFRVADADGIDCVILMYMPLSEGVWHNVSAKATEDNAKESFYEASFVGPKDCVDWKVFANDTQGRWSENGTIRYLLDMVGVDPRIVVAVTFPVMLMMVGEVLYKKRRR